MAMYTTVARCKSSLVLVQYLLLILVLMTEIPSCFCHDTRSRCLESERRALLDVAKGIYDPDDWLSSWRMGGDCCDWRVGCDDATGHVTDLDLQYPYEYDLHDGSGKIPRASKLSPSLSNLTHLKYLDLSMNNFSEAPIPEFIGSLAHLEYLDLSSSAFHGKIPPHLGNLSSLKSLYIEDKINPPSFKLHAKDLHWLSHLTSLSELRMSGVNLSSAADWIYDIIKISHLSVLVLEYVGLSSIPTSIPSVNNFTSLNHIDLFGNPFNSIFPKWLFDNATSLVNLAIGNAGLFGELPLTSGHVTNLRVLDLSRNKFGAKVLQPLHYFPNLEVLRLPYNAIDGLIPDSLLNLTRLRHLDLSVNRITGSLVKVLENLINLKELDLSQNQISEYLPKTLGNYTQIESLSVFSNRLSGEIPENIGNLCNLTEIDLSNNQISGILPDTIGNFAKLEYIIISSNLITGEIPHSLFNNSLLHALYFSNNSIHGCIPKAIGNLRNLLILDLSKNRLTGPILLDNLTTLESLDLSSNSLYGRIPQFRNETSRLIIVNLSNNSFSGLIPNSFGFLPNLQSLHLGRNDLYGGIPWSLKLCQQLVVLDLSENKLSGNIPTWLGVSLSSLGILSLRSNRLSGHIPMQLSYLSSLQILDISQNNLTGSLSLSFGNFSYMIANPNTGDSRFFVYGKALYLEDLWLTTKGNVLDYTTTVLSAVTSIDISSNNLSGEIPDGLTLLVGMGFLNLSRNHFTGKIMHNIGDMKKLESLDLSTNNLSGEIPLSMSGLTFLGYLNLSNNNLFGTIPAINQFLSFTNPSIYSGNQGLCGWPLPKCLGNSPPGGNSQDDEEHGDDHEMVWISVSAVLGFIISFWAFFGTIMIYPSIRHAYFRSIDDLYDWIYVKFALSIARLKSRMLRTPKL